MLNFIWSSRNSYFPWDLAATLLNSTLTSVNLRLFVGKPSAAVSCARNAAFRPGVVPNISSFFKPNTVRTLCLTCRSLAGEPCGAAISAYIEQCKALQELRIDSPFPDLLRALSTPLYTLAVTFSTAEMCEFVLEGLRDRWHGLSQLRILELEWAPATATNDVAARTRTWHTLRDECKRWGITFQCELPVRATEPRRLAENQLTSGTPAQASS